MVNLQAILSCAVVGPSASHKEERKVITYKELKVKQVLQTIKVSTVCTFHVVLMVFHVFSCLTNPC